MIEAAEDYLPPETATKQTYRRVIAMHQEVSGDLASIQAMDEADASLVARDYLLAGLAYFANRGHDLQMQEIGATAWYALQQQSVELVYADKVQPKAMELGVEPHLAYRYLEGEPHVLFDALIKLGLTEETGYLLIPSPFLVKVHAKPIEALATTINLASHVKDFVNGRLVLDHDKTDTRSKPIKTRAEAAEAHFLHEVFRVRKERVDVYYRGLMKKYPRGLGSVPMQMRYSAAAPRRDDTKDYLN